jgi:hypothetical protein
MPLQKKPEPVQLFLPSSNDLPEDQKEWVTLRVGQLLGGDILRSISDVESMMLSVLVGRIVEWNVRDLEGNVAAITAENVSMLPMEDLTFLLEKFKGDEEAATSKDPKVQIPINEL